MQEVDFSGVFDSVSDDTGVEEQEVTEPADEETENTDETEVEETEEGEEEQEPAEPAQSDEDNAKYAAARRKAEQEKELAVKEAIEKAKAEIRAQYDNMIASSGLLNPYTKSPVKSVDDFKGWQEAYSKEQSAYLKEKLEEAGMDEEEIDQLISSHPAVREAQQLKMQLEQHEKEVQEQRYRGIIEESLKQIQEYDPSIKSIKDLAESEHGKEIEEKIKQGYSISDAWKLANLDMIVQRQAKAAKIETTKNIASKEHLEKSGQRGQNQITVPQDVVNEYRKFNPKATIEQIQKHYAKDVKLFKKKKG